MRGYRLGRPGWVIAGWAVAAWQLTIGFTLGLPMAHLIGFLGIIAAVIWWRRGRPPLPRRLVVATVIGIAIYAFTAAAIGRPYLRVASTIPRRSARRRPWAFSGPAKVFLIAPEGERDLGTGDGLAARRPLRDPEKTLFPGLVILVLAIVTVFNDALPRRLRIGLGSAWSGSRSWRSDSRSRTAPYGPTGSSSTLIRSGRRSVSQGG